MHFYLAPISHIPFSQTNGILLSNNLANRHSPVVVIVSLSSQIYKKKRLPVHCLLKASETGLKCDSLALCEQPLSIGKSQLLNYVCSLDEKSMSRIDDCLRIQLCLWASSSFPHIRLRGILQIEREKLQLLSFLFLLFILMQLFWVVLCHPLIGTAIWLP